MPESNGHITAPVGLATVAKVLGESCTDTLTLSKSAKINPFSLFKPTYSTVPGLISTDLKTHNPGKTYAGKNGYTYELQCYGYYVPSYTKGTGAINLSDNFGELLWRHPPVEGNGSDFGNASLFENYFHNAGVYDRFSIYRKGDVLRRHPIAGESAIARFTLDNNDNTCISANNILEGKYLGVWFYDIAKNNNIFRVSSQVLKPDVSFVEIEIPASEISSVGQYKFVPVAVTSVPVTNTTKIYSLSIDCDKSIEMYIGDDGQIFVDSMTWMQRTRRFYINLRLGNFYVGTYQLTNLSVQFDIYRGTETVPFKRQTFNKDGEFDMSGNKVSSNTTIPMSLNLPGRSNTTVMTPTFTSVGFELGGDNYSQYTKIVVTFTAQYVADGKTHNMRHSINIFGSQLTPS